VLSTGLELCGLAAFVAAVTVIALWVTGTVLAAVGLGLLATAPCLLYVAWGLSAQPAQKSKLVRIPRSVLTNSDVDDRAA
jgi:hypothetical protein